MNFFNLIYIRSLININIVLLDFKIQYFKHFQPTDSIDYSRNEIFVVSVDFPKFIIFRIGNQIFWINSQNFNTRMQLSQLPHSINFIHFPIQFLCFLQFTLFNILFRLIRVSKFSLLIFFQQSKHFFLFIFQLFSLLHCLFYIQFHLQFLSLSLSSTHLFSHFYSFSLFFQFFLFFLLFFFFSYFCL